MIANLIAYVGPETTLPIASAIVASVGFLLAFGRSSLRFVKKIGSALFRERVASKDWRQKPR